MLIKKVADFWPALIVTVLGTVADLLLLARVTITPLGPATPPRVTVPVVVSPPVIVGDVKLTAERADGLTISEVALALDPVPAVRVTDVWVSTPFVVASNVAVVAPGAKITAAGTVTLGLLEDRDTVAPTSEAGEARVTVPVEESPP